MTSSDLDLRPLLFGDAEWFRRLKEPSGDDPSAWYMTKGMDYWSRPLLNAAAAFARDHSLLDTYRARFAGIRPQDLMPDRAAANNRTVSAPIRAIANELIVARYVERVNGWKFLEHEPPGAKKARGDWLFETSSKKYVFVEVKTIEEPEPAEGGGVYNISARFPRIRDALREAYKQLPADGLSTMIVLVGDQMLSVSYGILLSVLGQALFGSYQVTFKPFEEAKDMRAGPSFYNTLIHGTKHRRAGCIAGLRVKGVDIPEMHFYSIDNPYAYAQARIPHKDFGPGLKLIVDEHGHGEELREITLDEIWSRMRQGE